MLRLLVFAAAAALSAQPGPSDILTPKPGPEPRINGPKVYGVRPAKPFLYRIPCSGQRPIEFRATALPPGISLDPSTGILKGAAPGKAGTYKLQLEARNRFGTARREFRLVVGDTLALTPPMGWNDWYTHYNRITDSDVRAAAQAMVASGMADAGYAYVNIDDCWMRKPSENEQPLRDEKGLLPNSRFPDMRALTDYIHSLGLKAGIYTSPGPTTCARYAGSYEHEQTDAREFADWGFDFLKYDWCSYTSVAKGKDLEQLKAPYVKMGSILKGLDRDIVFNLCQYGMGDVWKWGADVGGHSWRTTGDLGVEKDTRLPGFYTIGFKNAQLAGFAGPGRWNDPDYILIGTVGNAHKMDAPPQRTKLTASEQYSYMSMWALMASPLFFSGDMRTLDDFTLNVLCNREVIDVNQDVRGLQAKIVRKTDAEFVLAKVLDDGAIAVGLFNIADEARQISIDWRELEVSGELAVRDLWRYKTEGVRTGSYQADVPAHGVKLVRLQKP